MNPFKRIILWDYSRGTWQYDVLCLLIIAFIFLTPKTWFDRREKLATQTAESNVKTQDFSPQPIQIRVRQLAGENEVQIIGILERDREIGEKFYELGY
jgi:hypothetical protein